MPDPEVKMVKCRACGKDIEKGKPCDNEGCGYDEDGEKLKAKKRRLDREQDEELNAEIEKNKPAKKEEKKRRFLPFRGE